MFSKNGDSNSNGKKYYINTPGSNSTNKSSLKKDESVSQSNKYINKNNISMNVFKSNSTFNNDKNYLKCRKWENLNDDNESSIEQKFELIGQSINKDELNILIDNIRKNDLNKIFKQNNNFDENENTIGTLKTLNSLIENTYLKFSVEQIIKNSDMLRLKPYVYKYRQIKKDDHCLFRGIIFYFLECIILTKNKMLMKELLILFNEKISLDNPKIQNKDYIIDNIKKIDREIVIKVLYIIINYIDEENIEKDDDLTAYIILLKIFLYCPEFDYGIIFFTRYLIYEFISENEDKIYSKEIKIKIGNLLPNKYIINNNGEYEYLFEEFYKELLSMGKMIENIIIFIAPYVFIFNLNILKYSYGKENNEIKEKPYKCGKHTDYEIFLIIRDEHYDIYYKKYFYEKYYQKMDILLDEEDNNNSFEDEVNSKIKNGSYKNQALKRTTINNQNYNRKLDNDRSNLNIDTKKNINSKSMQEKHQTYIITNSSINNSFINNENYPKCLKCHNQYYHKENVFGLCKECLSLQLKDEILTAYLTYIQKGYRLNCEETIKNYISEIKMTTLLQHDIYLDMAIINGGFTFKDLFNEIKQTICLYCGSNIVDNKYYFEFPCKCKICNKKCFDNYMSYIEEMNIMVLFNEKEDEKSIIPFTECPCGYKYNLKSFLNLINKMDKINEKSCKKIFEKQIKNNWKWMCMVCRQNFNRKTKFFRLILEDKKIDKELLKKYELKHLICNQCAKEKKIDNIQNRVTTINCNFCNSEHSIVFIKEVDENNNTKSACIII